VTPISSAIYSGTVGHARRGARSHAFSYRMYMLYLDLDELPGLALRSFRRSDFLGDPSRDLSLEVRDRVEAALGFRPEGPVRLLTHVRSLGYVFNPVSFYYCFERDGETLRAVVAEITNTPWGERHAYVIPAGDDGAASTFEKAFHVSPFYPMEQTYRWSLARPGDSLRVDMANLEKGQEVFRATLAMRRQAWSPAALRRAVLLQPLMAWKVHAAIYWQALRLWVKGVPFHVHPAKRATAAPRSTP
jgi:DUF1365 family protein